jgi:hypothetical protein
VNSVVYQHPPKTQAQDQPSSLRSRSGGIVQQSALLLLVLGVFADNHDAAFAFDDLALLANGFHTRSYFHGGSPFASYGQKIIFLKSFARLFETRSVEQPVPNADVAFFKISSCRAR